MILEVSSWQIDPKASLTAKLRKFKEKIVRAEWLMSDIKPSQAQYVFLINHSIYSILLSEEKYQFSLWKNKNEEKKENNDALTVN